MRFGAVCIAIYALCPSAPTFASELPSPHLVTLSQSRVSTAANGDVVIAVQAGGDLRGFVTLTIHTDDDVIAGEWSLVSAYFQDIDENGNPIEPEATEEDKPHVERIAYINNGTIGGTIDGGHLIVNANGAVTGIEGMRLTIVSSTLTFQGASGGGEIESPALDDGGSLSLTF